MPVLIGQILLEVEIVRREKPSIVIAVGCQISLGTGADSAGERALDRSEQLGKPNLSRIVRILIPKQQQCMGFEQLSQPAIAARGRDIPEVDIMDLDPEAVMQRCGNYVVIGNLTHGAGRSFLNRSDPIFPK